MADWKTLEIQVPGKDLLEQARSSLETLVVFLEVVKTLLETISLFLIDFGNPVRALVEALLNLILQLFDSLNRTGMYGYFDVPNPTQDPNFDRFRGGYQAFVERFKASLNDSRDPYRPQPTPGSTQSGFTLIVADAESSFGLMRLISILLRFFGREIGSAQYAAPANLKLFPAGVLPGAQAQGVNVDPVLQIAKLFGADLKGLSLEWSLATNQYPPDPGFTDLVATVSSEIIPQKWLIERTSNPQGPQILTKETTTNFEGRDGKPIKRMERVRDQYGDYFRVFEDYVVISAKENTASFLLGQLGTFRYLDERIDKDKTYFYRVRAYSGSLDVTGASDNEDVSFGTGLNLGEPEFSSLTNEYIQRWPSKDPSDPAIMGRPSPIISGRIPNIPPNLDVITLLENTFKMAFSLGFHLEVPEGSEFDDTGRNTGFTPVTAIGKGSLSNLSGPLALLIPPLELGSFAKIGFSSAGAVTRIETDATTGEYPNVTHNYYNVKAHSRKLAQIVGMTLFEGGGLDSFRSLFQNNMPLPVGGKGYFQLGTTTLEEMVTNYNILPAGFPDAYDPKVYETTYYAYNTANVRLNLLSAIRFLKAYSLGGVQPDWVSINLLQDVIPWSGKFIYELLSRMDALLDAFRSTLDELQAFIDLVIRKIDTLERFIQFLVEILNYLDSFSAGFYFLSVPTTDGGTAGWAEAIDTAGGIPPPSGPGGYTGGVGLAYVGTDVSAFASAFSLIF
jgi:hypothetical protein